MHAIRKYLVFIIFTIILFLNIQIWYDYKLEYEIMNEIFIKVETLCANDFFIQNLRHVKLDLNANGNTHLGHNTVYLNFLVIPHITQSFDNYFNMPVSNY